MRVSGPAVDLIRSAGLPTWGGSDPGWGTWESVLGAPEAGWQIRNHVKGSDLAWESLDRKEGAGIPDWVEGVEDLYWSVKIRLGDGVPDKDRGSSLLWGSIH